MNAAPWIEVRDAGDPRLADYTRLTDVALRTRTEEPNGLFIAEGELVIRRAARAGYRLRSVLAEPKWLPALADVLPARGVPVYAAEPAVLAALTGYHVHRGALAAFARAALPEPAELLARARRVAVLEAVNSHTNLGAIFRCAAGLGMDAVLLSPQCADPLYRRSVRVSMGEVLAVPYARLAPWPEALATVRAAGFMLVALTPDPGATPLHRLEVGAGDRVALLLGAEGPGLTAPVLAAAEARVRIPMARGVDSLNVAAAAAVAFYVLGSRPE